MPIPPRRAAVPWRHARRPRATSAAPCRCPVAPPTSTAAGFSGLPMGAVVTRGGAPAEVETSGLWTIQACQKPDSGLEAGFGGTFPATLAARPGSEARWSLGNTARVGIPEKWWRADVREPGGSSAARGPRAPRATPPRHAPAPRPRATPPAPRPRATPPAPRPRARPPRPPRHAPAPRPRATLPARPRPPGC